MRVTNNLLTQNLLKNLQIANNKMDLIQQQLASGQRITKPSDDPVKIETVMRLKGTLSRMEQWQKNAGQGLAFMNTTEGILANMTSMLQRVRELTVQAANGSNANEDQAQIGIEIKELTEQFWVLANSQYGAKYVFSGTKTDQVPMPLPYTDDSFQWQGNEELIVVEVGANLSMPISINGKELFGIEADGSSTFFQTLTHLSQAINDNDSDGINQALDEIDRHLDRVLSVRAELGARTNRLDVINNQLENSVINLKKNLSDIQDVDMAEAIMEFQSIQNTFRAALSVGSQIIQPSLVDFIR
ncbi:MAG: flagellar hook-associated protein FlgL [Bacillota bacterium]|jgi:flagellar hook-associated protein 3 FlgL|nr:flagellar hook-associated protein FlgL [Clostridia bacterium]